MAAILNTIKTALTSKGLDMPVYTTAENSKESQTYEERHYPESKWVSTKVVGMVHKDARSTGFRRLFKYIQGANEPSEKVEMTAPVATKIVPGAGPNCESTFTVSFFIPPENAENPPKPTDPDVFIETWPAQTIYAKQFGGSPKDDEYVSHAQELAQELSDKNINQNYWFTAGYDSPFKMFNRRNEVWYVKDDKANNTQ